MGFRCAAWIVLLTTAIARSVSAQEPPAACPSPEVTFRQNEAVPAPRGYEQAEVFFYDTAEGKKEDFRLTRGRPPVLIPDAQVMREAQKLSSEVPGRYKLLWEKPGATESCLQTFYFVLTCQPEKVTLQEGKAIPAPKGYDQGSVSFYDAKDKEIVLYDGKEPKLPLKRGTPVELLPDAQVMERARELENSSITEPDRYKLLWEKLGATPERCLQAFVVFDRPERVQLDATGVEGRYVNPVRPVPINGRPLQFFNNTGDRTFVVTIPFVYAAEEAASAYAVADYERGRQVLSDIVCKALLGSICNEANLNKLTEEESKTLKAELNELDKLEGLRVLLEAVSRAKPTTLEEKDCVPVKNGGCIAELFFWMATSEIGSDTLVSFARSYAGEANIRHRLDTQAMKFVDDLFVPQDPKRPFPSPEAFQAAKDRQAEINKKFDRATLEAEDAAFEAKATGRRPTEQDSAAVVPFSYEVKSAGLVSRFGTARIDLARRALTNAIREKMGFPPDTATEEERFFERLWRRLGLGDQGGESGYESGFPEKIRPLFGKLQDRWERIADDARNARRKGQNNDQAYYACLQREVEAAAKLLASYSPNSSVPYSGIPETLRDDKLAINKECENFRGKDDDLQMTQKFDALSEQGIEITNCQSTATTTTCSATATIPPYRRATFSRAILDHHPGPRISFTVSFFGDPEIPGNPNGYVTRGDATAADEKPKSAFLLQLGGDASTSFDPDPTVTGQLRHSGATGALSFLYSGPVEASATVQFKSGDFGGTASEVQATQYQAKVYGPKRLVLQYGKIPFAKPSSGIAINVFGEGVQLIMGQTSFGYVVLRESEEGIATPENKDSELALFQYRNIPLNWLPDELEFLRTLDLIAVYGEDRRDSAVNPPIPRPFTYFSGGGELRWGSRRFQAFSGSIAGYYSERNVGPVEDGVDPMLPLTGTVDGDGCVGLLRVSWTQLPVPQLKKLQPEVRPALGLSALFGYGTGDKQDSLDEDEGYLGENAAFSNDVLFLSRVANSADFSKELGRGLSNKRYLGMQLTTWHFSPLAIITQLIGAERDIASRSTVLTLHGYEFNHEVHGRQWAGKEVNLQFNLEAPKNIQWVLGGGYYWTATAVERVIRVTDKDLWSATLKLSIKLNSL